MTQPINVEMQLLIHRHYGRDDDDCELMVDGELVAKLVPDKGAKFLKDNLPKKIKEKTGFDMQEAIR